MQFWDKTLITCNRISIYSFLSCIVASVVTIKYFKLDTVIVAPFLAGHKFSRLGQQVIALHMEDSILLHLFSFNLYIFCMFLSDCKYANILRRHYETVINLMSNPDFTHFIFDIYTPVDKKVTKVDFNGW